MEKKLVEKAFEEASKDLEKEKKDKIKNIILETLKKREHLKEELEKLQKQIKNLNKDLEDFKNGRLDLIEERQKVDKSAKETSILRIEKIIEEHHHYYPRPWYEPYKVYFWDYTKCSNDGNFTATSDVMNLTIGTSTLPTCTGSDFHNNYSGTYQVNDHIINL